MKVAFYLIITFILITSFHELHAEEEKLDLQKGLAYPELEVTPRASERLLIEAKDERSHRISNHSSMLVSSLLTLITAFTSQDSPGDKNNSDNVDNNKWSTQVGYAVGGGWLLTNIVLMTSYEPYREGYKSIKQMPTGDKRDTLARERLAEEALYAPARLGTKLLWMSALTNLSASLYMMGYGNDTVKVYSSLSAIAALAPIFFPYRWIDVGEQHKLYKKKIYGPVASIQLLRVSTEDRPLPGLGWSMSF